MKTAKITIAFTIALATPAFAAYKFPPGYVPPAGYDETLTQEPTPIVTDKEKMATGWVQNFWLANGKRCNIEVSDAAIAEMSSAMADAWGGGSDVPAAINAASVIVGRIEADVKARYESATRVNIAEQMNKQEENDENYIDDRHCDRTFDANICRRRFYERYGSDATNDDFDL